jgi:SAM-dependent methyltransferase
MAALSDLATDEWRSVFAELESEQKLFLDCEDDFRSPEYRWPRDPLHNWSRLWEYPYVYSALRTWRAHQAGAASPTILDVGSGVTFFPFTIAKLDARVHCLDVDAVCVRDLGRAAAIVDSGRGQVSAEQSESDRLPCRDEVADAIYCISVLEHVEEPEPLITELGRVLKRGGLLLLTLDLDLREEGLAPSAKDWENLRFQLFHQFEPVYPERSVHPADLLTSIRAPYGFSRKHPPALAWHFVKQRLIKPLIGREGHRWPPFELAVMALALRKSDGL